MFNILTTIMIQYYHTNKLESFFLQILFIILVNMVYDYVYWSLSLFHTWLWFSVHKDSHTYFNQYQNYVVVFFSYY